MTNDLELIAYFFLTPKDRDSLEGRLALAQLHTEVDRLGGRIVEEQEQHRLRWRLKVYAPAGTEIVVEPVDFRDQVRMALQQQNQLGNGSLANRAGLYNQVGVGGFGGAIGGLGSGLASLGLGGIFDGYG